MDMVESVQSSKDGMVKSGFMRICFSGLMLWVWPCLNSTNIFDFPFSAYEVAMSALEIGRRHESCKTLAEF